MNHLQNNFIQIQRGPLSPLSLPLEAVAFYSQNLLADMMRFRTFLVLLLLSRVGRSFVSGELNFKIMQSVSLEDFAFPSSKQHQLISSILCNGDIASKNRNPKRGLMYLSATPCGLNLEFVCLKHRWGECLVRLSSLSLVLMTTTATNRSSPASLFRYVYSKNVGHVSAGEAALLNFHPPRHFRIVISIGQSPQQIMECVSPQNQSYDEFWTFLG